MFFDSILFQAALAYLLLLFGFGLLPLWTLSTVGRLDSLTLVQFGLEVFLTPLLGGLNVARELSVFKR